MTTKPKALTVLEALYFGLEVKTFPGGNSAIMSEDGKVGVPYNGGVISTPWDLNDFLSWCEKISDEYIFELNANIALNKLKRSEAKKRNLKEI